MLDPHLSLSATSAGLSANRRFIPYRYRLSRALAHQYPLSPSEGAWQVFAVPGGSLDLVATSPGEVEPPSPLASWDLTFYRSNFHFHKTLRTRARVYVWLKNRGNFDF